MTTAVSLVAGSSSLSDPPMVVIVDDEPLVVRALARLLRRSYVVVSVTTPEEAIDVVDRHDVAVVLSDQRMPGMGGTDLLALIHRRDPRVMGLLITAYADIDAVAAAINDPGVVGYLRKPWRDRDVVEAVQRAVVAHDDAGSRARERAELVRQEEAVRVLVDHAPIGVAVLGRTPQLVFVRCNAPFLQLVSAPTASVVGTPLSRLLGPEASDAIHALCHRAERSGEVMASPELEWTLPGQTVRHVTCTVSPLGSGAGPAVGSGLVTGPESVQPGFVLTAADITEAVASREEARRLAALQAAILEQLPSGVVVVDADGRTLVVNDMARRLRPALTDPSAEHVRQGPRHTQSGQPLRPDELPLARALTGERIVDLDYRQEGADGTDVWIRASAAPLRTRRDEISGAVSVYTDVTADHLAEQGRSIALASASHELRTPLTSTLGFTALLLAGEIGPLSDQQVRAVSRIKSSAERLQLLIEDIMDITSIEAGQLALHPSTVDIGALLARVVDSFEPQVRAKHQELILDRPPAPLLARADDHRVEQVVTNLVSNAHKYTLTGGRIVVSAAGDAAGVSVTVQDTGVGLTADEIGQLGTKFYRARNRDTWDVPGTGLGLAITRALVERQGGSLSITSTPGQGSVFEIRLPADRSPSAT